MNNKHMSSQYDAELNSISTRVLEMGGLVEIQIRHSIKAIHELSVDEAQHVLSIEREINRMETEIDREITSIMCRRQPTARDLRLLVGISRVILNLERAGDETSRIARMIKLVIQSGAYRSLPLADLVLSAQHCAASLHQTLDAFARLDVDASLTIINNDALIDQEYEGYLRKLITYMMEDPRTIGSSINLLFLAKAIERVGDHAKNIAEATIYVVKGTDIRHATREERDSVIE